MPPAEPGCEVEDEDPVGRAFRDVEERRERAAPDNSPVRWPAPVAMSRPTLYELPSPETFSENVPPAVYLYQTPLPTAGATALVVQATLEVAGRGPAGVLLGAVRQRPDHLRATRVVVRGAEVALRPTLPGSASTAIAASIPAVNAALIRSHRSPPSGRRAGTLDPHLALREVPGQGPGDPRSSDSGHEGRGTTRLLPARGKQTGLGSGTLPPACSTMSSPMPSRPCAKPSRRPSSNAKPSRSTSRSTSSSAT